MNKLFSVLLLFVLLSSCASRKDFVYLQSSGSISDEVYEKFAPKIQAEDMITITVSAADLKATLPFNQQSPYQLQAGASTDFAFKPTFLVNDHGEIDYPVLGKIKLGGLTRLQAIDYLKERLKRYIIEPSVNLTFANFKVTVLGEVNRPGSYTLPQERITVFEALGLAGDMTIRGLRKNVLLLREQNGKKSVHRIDLTTDSVMASPYYYLAQNDVVYVEPNASQIRGSSLGQNTNVLISISSLVITIVAIIIR